MCNLTNKYNVPGPRYTSYPTVPYWDTDNFSGKKWKLSVKESFDQSKSDGISLYIHLPFCEQMCTFCGCHKRITKRHEVETPYINAVIKEWSLYRDLLGSKPTIKELHLGGGTPTFFSPENLTRLINGIFRFARRAQDAELSFEGHPNNTSKEHLQALYNVGFRRVCFGVQDYNETVQKAINRVQPFENVRNVTNSAREIGYTSVGHDIIYGLPFQTLDDIKNTIKKTNELRPDRLAFYSYAHVPWLKGNGQRGYKDEDLPTAEDKKLQYEIGKKRLIALGYEDIGMDHFALSTDALFTAAQNGELHRNFMGYTASKTQLMIGLGASSISDSWHAFAQNVKNIEEYQHLVAHDIIPVYRGHVLNQEDELIRKHILNLMCQFETSWEIGQTHLLDIQHIIDNLTELEKDGLVEIGANSIKVTTKGKPFIRNISMAFDLKLQRKKPDTRLFSMTI
ncbi:oxygen-independent coproporphyrinogen III oxidase [uncultured Croceitalea sp.]|uniref:oxygen-independent coproporphyrinogen III oxidase n=1 Tax=uncultured Croceitalea sp. TaxID=1798908 RepID=UPI003305DFE1